MQAFYDSKPSKFEAVGNGSYLYRFNIREVETEDGGSQWVCDEVTVWSPVSSNKITEAVIVECYPSDYEQKLINEYNAAQLGLISGEEAERKTAAYRAFLTARAELKAQVDADCAELGIK